MCRAQTAHQQDSFWDPDNVLSFYFKQKPYLYLKALQSISIAAEKKRVFNNTASVEEKNELFNDFDGQKNQ